MDEAKAKAWTKDRNNQRTVINSHVGIDTPRGKKVAFFMAGIPGAGKTEFVLGMRTRESPLKDFVIIEHDQLVEYIDAYKPEHYYNYRKAGSTLVTALFSHCLAHEFPFIFDGTLSHDNARRNIKKSLEHGYETTIIYIHQDIKSAWQLTKDRELVKKRAIERMGFMQTAQRINNTLRNIFDEFCHEENFAFWIIKKDGSPGMENATMIAYEGSAPKYGRAGIEAILDQQYNIEEID